MKYPILAGVLTLALGGGAALADDPDATAPPATGSTPSQSDQYDQMQSGQQSKTQPQTGAQAQPQTQAKTDAEQTAALGTISDNAAHSVFFDTASASVDSAQANDRLRSVAKFAKCHRNSAVILQGFADPRGTAEFNLDLSARRAAAVRDKLMVMGVKPGQITIEAWGETQSKGQPYAQDRRVTAKIEPNGLQPAATNENLSG